MPGGVFGAGLLQHLVDGLLILGPFLPVAPVFLRELPLFFRGVLPGVEALQLGIRIDLDPEFQHHGAPLRQLALEFVDLIVGPLPVLFGAEALQPLHHHPAVPGAVEDGKVPASGQLGPETPQILAVQLMGLRRGDGDHVEAPGIQVPGQTPDVSALARGVPSLIADHHGDALPVHQIMQVSQPFLELLQFLIIFLVLQGGAQIHFPEQRHLHQGKIRLEGLAHIPACFQAFADGFGQQLQGVPDGGTPALPLQHVPGHRFPRGRHEVLISLTEALILPVLPQVVLRHPPFGGEVLPQGAEPLLLLLPIDAQEDLQQEIPSVPELTLEFRCAADIFPILFPGDLPSEIPAHRTFHPPGIVEHELPVFRDLLGIGPEEGIPIVLRRSHGGGNHVVKPGIQLADELSDEAALARGGPALHQNDHRQARVPQFHLLSRQSLPQGFDLRPKRLFFLGLVLFAHCRPPLFSPHEVFHPRPPQ